MARMSIDDMIVRDPRITKLAGLVGWSRRETVGCLIADVWPICYDQREAVISSDLVDLAAGQPGFADAMVRSELATWTRGNQRIRIRGAQERIEYLDKKKRAGSVGGTKSAESRSKKSSTTTDDAQARGNPSASVPDPVSASVPDVANSEKNSARPSVGGTRSRSKPSEPTAEERSTAMFVLQKLGQRSGVTYSGAAEHVRLIVAQLRNGVTETDLRKVIGYCAIELDWPNNPDMAKYLRPETLFGPKTIAKYLDPARTWFAKQPGLQFDERPKLEVVQ